MKVVGPSSWPSTQRLVDALASVESDKVLYYGTQNRISAIEQLSKFKLAGLNTPEFTTNLDEAKKWVISNSKVLGRKQFHTQGNDIIGSGFRARQSKIRKEVERLVWITTRRGNHVQRLRRRLEVVPGQTVEKWNKRWEASDFWVKFIPSTREFRQHIFDGKAIRVGEKIEAGPHPRTQLVRSRNNGWHIQYPPSTPPPAELRDVAKAALKSVGYLFGAVDILLGEDGKLYVLEVNSAPSMGDDATLNAYVEEVKKWVRKN